MKIIFCCSVTVRPLRQHQHGAQMVLVTVTLTWGIALLTHSTRLRQVVAPFALDVTRERSSSSTGEQGGWAEMASRPIKARPAVAVFDISHCGSPRGTAGQRLNG